MNRKPILEKPYRVPLNVDNRKLPYKSLKTVCIGDTFRFTFFGGSEFGAMKIARSQWPGRQVIEMKEL